MNDNPVIEYLKNIDWAGAFQWYMTHLDANHLYMLWQHGKPFSQEEWITISLIAANLMVMGYFIHLLVKRMKEARFRKWIETRRSMVTAHPPSEGNTKIEPKATGSNDLKQAYNLHRLAMYEKALLKYKAAVYSAPYEINTYLVGIKIFSEMDLPDAPFKKFLTRILTRLREQRPDLWKDVARYGNEVAPDLVNA